ncbi:MAG: cation:proton antiporter [Nocardioides sp.]|nr:cation:proton antiporter [Nocardioides sp.]
MDEHAFPIIAGVLALAAVVGFIATRLRQPLLIAFLGVGVLVGPVGTGWVVADGTIELLARLGISVLLFLVGLRLDLHLIRSVGPVALATGLGQVIFTSVVGFGIAMALGLDLVPAIYVAVALTFSSTIIIVKLLSDKRELDQLHGRIAVGFLIVQDIVVVVVMIVLTAFGRQEGADDLASGVLVMLVQGAALLIGIVVLSRYVMPWLLHHMARSPELLVLFGVAYAASVAALSEWMGFSSEVGAFLAGMSLASTAYRDALGAQLTGLRDFLLLFFFLDLGARLEFGEAAAQVTEALVLSAFVLIGNPIVVILIMASMRYPVRVGFLAGLTVAQISEFSLILAALGLSLGHITNATVSLITVVGVITIGVSTYLIVFSHEIWARIGGWFAFLERREPVSVQVDPPDPTDVVLYGLGRFGRHLAADLAEDGHAVLAVDHDPRRVALHERLGVTATYGSAEDVHFLETLPLGAARAVVSAVPEVGTNLALLHGLRHHGYAGAVVLTAHNEHDADQLREAGVDVVLEPFLMAAATAAEQLREVLAGPPS